MVKRSHPGARTDAAPSFFEPTAPGFSYDAEKVEHDKARRAYKLNAVQIPLFRIIGFSFLTLVTFLYDLNLAGPFPAQGFFTVLIFNLAYGLGCMVLMRLLYGRVGRFDLTLLFLHLDVLAWLVTLHHVAGTQLLFVFFLLVRVGDQVGYGFRRAFYFNHVVIAAYLTYVGWFMLAGGAAAPLADYLLLAAAMYVAGLYIAMTGIAIETLRKRTGVAVRQARDLLRRLDEQTRHLHAQAAALEQARIQAESANHAKNEFLASMSHELRTPLNAILGYAQLLQTRDDLPADALDHIGEVEQAGNQLLSLMNDILDLAQIESGNLKVQLEALAPADTLATCQAQHRHTAQNRQIALSFQNNCPSGQTVLADRRGLLQVLNNLVSNAIKYNRQNGQVTVVCGLTPQGNVRFTVSDTGQGIDADKQALLFQPFNRLGAERGTVEGTGIGLVITRRLTTQMNGSIGFESQKGQGSTFWVEFPAASAVQPAPQAAAAS